MVYLVIMRTTGHSRGQAARKTSNLKYRTVRQDHPAAGGEGTLREVATAYGVKQETFSRMSGFSLRAVAHWFSGKTPGEAARIRLTELKRLLKALAQIVEPAAIESWLQTPNPAFEGSTPLQVIERGEMDRLWLMLHQLGSGEPG
jgi:hypothetical protein